MKEFKRTGKDLVIWKLNNVLRGHAMLIRDDKTMDPKDRKEQMQVIEQLVNFLKDYDNNIAILDVVRQTPITPDKSDDMLI